MQCLRNMYFVSGISLEAECFSLHCVKEELGPWNTNLFNRFSPCTARLRCKGDTNIYVALDVHWWWKQSPGELITDDVGGYAKPGKKVFNISFGADGCLQQAYCHLGWGLFPEWRYLTHPNSLCFCQIKANQMTKTHPWSTWSDVADVALAEKKQVCAFFIIIFIFCFCFLNSHK